jgi:uncharacterized protein YheU (UPF0270 family)
MLGAEDPMPLPEGAVLVPHESLEPQTLRSLAEEYVTRDGTDYGRVERSLEDKVSGLLRELERGEARIVFDAESGTINVVTRRELPEDL